MRSQDDCTGLVARDVSDNFPHKTSSGRVHACRRLIEQNDGWTSDDRDGYRELSLVASRELAGKFGTILLQTKLLDSLIYKFRSNFAWNTFDPCEVVYVFLYTERIKDRVSLWAVANKFSNFVEVFVDIECTDVDATFCWFDFTGQVFESRRFTGSIDTK